MRELVIEDPEDFIQFLKERVWKGDERPVKVMRVFNVLDVESRYKSENV